MSKNGMFINLTNVSTSEAINLAKGYPVTKIRIMTAIETKIRVRVSKTKESIKVMRLIMIKEINQGIINYLESENESLSKSLNSFGVQDFEKKFTDEEIYRMMLGLPTKIKKDPKLILIQKIYGVSKRQAGKIKEMIPKDVYNLI